MHPNTAAQAAGGALLIVLAGHLLWRWSWARKALVPTVPATVWLLYRAHSRTAIVATLLAVVACLLLAGRRKMLLTAAMVFIVGFALYLTVDPRGSLLDSVSERTVGYTMRGQSKEQFMSATGRVEMWGIGLDSFRKSPLLGHGNWVMTPGGLAFTWGEEQFQTLHNLVLHVTVGTGLIGGLLFLWSQLRPLNVIRRGLRHASPDRSAAAFALVVFLWFFAIGLFEISFMGPVGPVTIFYFVTLGIVCGRLPREGRPGGQPAPVEGHTTP